MNQNSLKSLLQVVMGVGRTERRCETRLPAHGLACIRWENDGETRLEAISLLGVSERGISFRSTQSFTVGQKIRVEAQDEAVESFESFVAVVRHVAPDGHEFVAGAEAVAHLPGETNAAVEQVATER